MWRKNGRCEWNRNGLKHVLFLIRKRSLVSVGQQFHLVPMYGSSPKGQIPYPVSRGPCSHLCTSHISYLPLCFQLLLSNCCFVLSKLTGLSKQAPRLIQGRFMEGTAAPQNGHRPDAGYWDSNKVFGENSIAVAQQKSLMFEECRVLLTACKSSLRRNKSSPSPGPESSRI